MTLHGQVKNGVVVLDNGAPLPEGARVRVTTIEPEPPEPISEERREALLGLIGMWKVDNPPDDEEVRRIIDEYRMEKYG